jgi:tetratricopeptide (TPR) repeat protein
MTLRRRCLLLLACLLLLGLVQRFEDRARSGSGGAAEGTFLGGRQAHLKRAFERARRDLIECPPEVLAPRRRAAATAAEAFADHPLTPHKQRLEAWLAAASWLRTAGDPRARQLFARVAREGSTYQRGRARLELAHLWRRGGDLEAALALYEDLQLDRNADPSHRDDAAWWFARTCELAGDDGAARRRWRRLADDAVDPCLRARAWDRLARSYLVCGDVDAACAALRAGTRALSARASEHSPRGAALRATLAAMSARSRLDGCDVALDGAEFSLTSARSTLPK